LKDNGQQGKLNAHQPWKTTGPHFITSIGIGLFDGPRHGIIIDIHDTVPSHEDSIKQGNVLNEWIHPQPIYQETNEIDENEGNAKTYQELVGREAMDNIVAHGERKQQKRKGNKKKHGLEMQHDKRIHHFPIF
jgi:hypothetical protein